MSSRREVKKIWTAICDKKGKHVFSHKNQSGLSFSLLERRGIHRREFFADVAVRL